MVWTRITDDLCPYRPHRIEKKRKERKNPSQMSDEPKLGSHNRLPNVFRPRFLGRGGAVFCRLLARFPPNLLCFIQVDPHSFAHLLSYLISSGYRGRSRGCCRRRSQPLRKSRQIGQIFHKVLSGNRQGAIVRG